MFAFRVNGNVHKITVKGIIPWLSFLITVLFSYSLMLEANLKLMKTFMDILINYRLFLNIHYQYRIYQDHLPPSQNTLYVFFLTVKKNNHQGLRGFQTLQASCSLSGPLYEEAIRLFRAGLFIIGSLVL